MAMMIKNNLLKAVKIFLIILFLMAISILAVMQWKSDLILDRVIAAVQHQLVDSLHYGDARMDWFTFFPSASIHIHALKMGSGNKPLISGGDVDIVIPLLPLLKDKIIINRLQVNHAAIHILQHNGRWSYDILQASASTAEPSFTALVRQLVIENSTLTYHDGKNMGFILAISNSNIKGRFEDRRLESQITLEGEWHEWVMKDYKQPGSFPFKFEGQYAYDLNAGLQVFKECHLQHEGMTLAGDGTLLKKPGFEEVDIVFSWKNGRPEMMNKWIPEKSRQPWNHFTLTGESDGHVKIKGISSKTESPHILCTATMKNGGIDFISGGESITGLQLDLTYDSGAEKPRQKSQIIIDVKKSPFRGQALEGQIKVVNLRKPIIDATFKGSLPAGLLNLVAIPSIQFEKGELDLNHFELRGFQPELSTLIYFLQKSKALLSGKDVHFTYLGNTISLPEGDLEVKDGILRTNFDHFTWNKAAVKNLKGKFESGDDQLAFDVSGMLCEGEVEAQGTISGLGKRPSFSAHGKMKGVEMKKLFESFSNFDQTFITSENLKGKATIWAEIIIPFDEKWNILSRGIRVKSAMDIHEGQLKGMKTLEDFSQYVHLDDLRDIRFNQMRNYVKIEDGKVYLPVMFIQSSAINLSISGVHGFDHKILYNLKLNAGQAATQKLKKSDVKKDFKQARKSGWINMYYILEGTTSAVRYQQYRTAVISGFEQSAALKESLRNSLVERFGYDVYWLEPNEWEDIPEYR